MPLRKTCGHCSKEYLVPPAREGSRFCSRQCRSAADRTRETRTIACEACGSRFVAFKDHGHWPRFCCRDCWQADKKQADDRECQTCGGVFKAKSRGMVDDRGRYCSLKCRNIGYRVGDIFECIACGEGFYLQRGRDDRCCSNTCRLEYYKDDRSPAWKGGRYEANGDIMVKMERPGYVGKYMAEHRIVASKAIGRMLFRHEIVIRVSGERDDIRPENLFICATASEYAKRRNGSLPWPTKSNLSTYRDRATPSRSPA